MFQPGFNRGACSSSMWCTRLANGFMHKASLEKALQDYLRELGTGQAAHPPAVSAAQAVPPVPHLAAPFPLKEEVVFHHTCNPDTILAPETLE